MDGGADDAALAALPLRTPLAAYAPLLPGLRGQGFEQARSGGGQAALARGWRGRGASGAAAAAAPHASPPLAPACPSLTPACPPAPAPPALALR